MDTWEGLRGGATPGTICQADRPSSRDGPSVNFISDTLATSLLMGTDLQREPLGYCLLKSLLATTLVVLLVIFLTAGASAAQIVMAPIPGKLTAPWDTQQHMPLIAPGGEGLGGYNKSVVLISWDGTRRETLTAPLDQEKLPNLKKLIDKGQLVDLVITDHYTDTMAGHTEMLTGYPPAVTGVYNNFQYAEIPEGYT
ncbi:MAG: alkaline phosphatase family protein, partial [Methanomicrobiales archaeon]|nr:alkaline phosphatase family protein [Methanomicrobiales archaeon]